jgi:hypothetical protein
MNYLNVDFDITYHIGDINCDENDTKYRSDLLAFFKLDAYNDTIISMRTDRLFHELKKQPQFEQIFETCLTIPIVSMLSTSETEISSACLVLLFSHDYFYLLFNCLQDYKADGNISSGNFNLIQETIRNNNIQ